MLITDEISQLWECDFNEVYNGRKKERKVLGKSPRILVIFNEHNFDRISFEQCPFDSPERNSCYRKYRGLWYGINSRPVEEKHVILFPSEHREWPAEKDFEDILNFTSETEYTCSLNLRGSGASIGNHVHFQAVREEFPCFQDRKIPYTKNRQISVYGLDLHYHGALIQANSSQRKSVSKLANLRKPYNAILKSKNGEDYVFVYSRTQTFSKTLKDFKIGAPEMARLFYAKTYEQYKDWDYNDILESLREVCPQEERTRHLFNKEISELVIDK